MTGVLAYVLACFILPLATLLWALAAQPAPHSRGLRLLRVYLGLAALNTIAMGWMAWQHRNNTILIHLFIPAQFLLFAGMYRNWSNPHFSRWWLNLMAGYGAFWILRFPFENHLDFRGPLFHVHMLAFLCMAIGMLVYFSLQPITLTRHPGFWVAGSALVDASFTGLFFLWLDWLRQQPLLRPWILTLFVVRGLLVCLTYLGYRKALTLQEAASCFP